MATTYTLEDGSHGSFDTFVKGQNFTESFENALIEAANAGKFGSSPIDFAFESENDADGAPGSNFEGILFKGAQGDVDFDEATGQPIVLFDGDKGIRLDYEATRSQWIGATAGADRIDIESTAAQQMVVDGGAGDDKISTGDGRDTLYGGDGDDRLYAGGGNDSVDGGDGDDRLYGEGGNDAIAGGKGNDRLYGGAGNDDLDGGDGNDRVYGDAGNDRIHGGKGNDDLYGGAGNDTIYTDKGDDTVHGDGGNDQIYAGSGNSVIDGGDGNDEVYLGTGDATVTGGDGNDDIYGGRGDALINAGKGNDSVTLDIGDATVVGGDGNDTVTAGEGDADVSLGKGNDVFEGGLGYATVHGGDGADEINAGEGETVAYGDGGDDLFTAGDGSATIDGGAGFDIATFSGERPDFSFDADTGTWDLGSLGEMKNVEFAQFDDGGVLITVQNDADAQIARIYQIVTDSDPTAGDFKSMLEAFHGGASVEDIVTGIDASLAGNASNPTDAETFLSEKFGNIGVDAEGSLYDTLLESLSDGSITKAEAVASIALNVTSADDELGIKVHTGLV